MRAFTRARPVRAPLPSHLPREPRHPWRSSSPTRATAAGRIRATTCRDMRGSCKPTRTLGSMTPTIRRASPAQSSRRHAGHAGAASCSCSPMSRRLHSRSKQCGASMRSSPSSATSTACPRHSAWLRGRFRWRPSSPRSKRGCARTRQVVARRQCGEGDGLHAQALGRLRTLPGRRAYLPDQQRRRARIARGGSRATRLAVRRARQCRIRPHQLSIFAPWYPIARDLTFVSSLSQPTELIFFSDSNG